MKKGILTLGITAILISSTALFAKGGDRGDFGPGDRNGPRGGGITSLFSDLNLTAEQQKNIELLEVEFRYSQASNQSDREAVLKSAITSSGFDKAKFTEAMLSESTSRSEAFASHLEAIFAILTDAQKASLYSNINQ